MYRQRDGTGGWNPTLWKTMARLSCNECLIFEYTNTVVVDGMATQGVRTSAAILLIQPHYSGCSTRSVINTLRHERNGLHFCIFVKDRYHISFWISLKFALKNTNM